MWSSLRCVENLLYACISATYGNKALGRDCRHPFYSWGNRGTAKLPSFPSRIELATEPPDSATGPELLLTPAVTDAVLLGENLRPPGAYVKMGKAQFLPGVSVTQVYTVRGSAANEESGV